MVSPMVMPVTPAMATMSPIWVSSMSVRFSPLKREQLGDLGLVQRAVALGDVHFFAVVQGSVEHARNRQAAEIVGVVEIGDQDLQRAVRVAAGRRDGGDDGFKQRLQVFAGRVRSRCWPCPAWRWCRAREIELVFVRVEIDEEVVYLVQDLFGAGVGTIDLVDDHHRRQLGFSALEST